MDSPDNIEVFVEIPRGSRNKYEYDEEIKAFRLDRVLYSSVHYPADYGFVPDTLAPDGDRLDVLVMVDEPTFPGCLVLARPVGLLHMVDQGIGDYKILAVPVRDPRYDEYRDLDSVPQHWLLEIENFFRIYKTLEGKETEIHGWEPREKALEVISEARQRNAERLSNA